MNLRTYGVAFGAGVIGALAMSVLMHFGVWMEWSPFSLEMLLGSWITGKMNTTAWVIGFIWHLINGGIFGILYETIFRLSGRPGVISGMSIGIFHWIVAGILLNGLFVIHPVVSLRYSVHPFVWYSFGVMTFLGSLFLHLVYGSIVGALCEPRPHRLPEEIPENPEENAAA